MGNKTFTEKEIQRECMTRLELFMVPQHIVFLDEMPKSSNSKIDKKELKKKCTSKMNKSELFESLSNDLKNKASPSGG